VTTVLESLI